MTSLLRCRMLASVHVLVTGFEPFGGFTHNPSQVALLGLPDQIGGLPIQRAVLPVNTVRIEHTLEPLWQQHPRVVVHTGLAETRTELSIEQIAVNRRAFDGPDNGGNIVRDAEVVDGGPPVLPSRIPGDHVARAWQSAGLNGRTSQSAGHFLCNQTFYLSLFHLPKTTAVGFVHLPPDETLTPGGPHLRLAEQVRGIALVVEAALRTPYGVAGSGASA